MKSIFSFLKKWSLALGVLCGVYVGYGHIASWLQLKRAPVPWSAQFATEPNAIARFKYDGSPAIKFAPTNVAVEMGYAGDAPLDEQALGLFSGPARRLESGVARLRFRFKGTNADGKERVVVGFRAESTRRKILVAMPRGDDAALFLWGDEKGARPDVDMPSTMETFPGPFVQWHGDEWHEIALRFDAARPSFIALVDGTPVASRLTDWRAGTEVAPVFGLFVDKDGRKATVEFGEAGWEPTPENRPVIGFDFLEEFRGPAVNIHRWHTDVANDWWIKGNVLKISSGAGLRLESQTLTTATQELLTPVELCLNPLELTPIRVRSRWKLETLSFASLYIGIYNINRNRIAEAAIRAEEPGTERMELRAHMHDAFRPEEIALSALPKNETRSYEVELRYDPWFRTATVSLDGVALTRHRLDLRRGEFVRVCVGQRLAPSGVAAAVLESVEVHAAAY